MLIIKFLVIMETSNKNSYKDLYEKDFYEKDLYESPFIPINSQFIVKKKIRSGAYSEVMEVTDFEQNNKYALKLYPFHEQLALCPVILREIDILSKTDHKNIIKPIRIFFGIMNDKTFICILLPLFELTLYEYIIQNQNNSKRQNMLIFNQILDAMFYIYQIGYSHNDLSYVNIMMHGDSPILIDFGFSKKIYRKFVGNFSTTLCIKAIELFSENNFFKNEKIDVWSLGCIYYFVKNKKVVALEDDPDEQIGKIFNKFGRPSRKLAKKLNIKNIKINFFKNFYVKNLRPNNHDKLLNKMLEYNPYKRIDIKKLSHICAKKNNYIAKIVNKISELDDYKNEFSINQKFLVFFCNILIEIVKNNDISDEIILTILYVSKKLLSSINLRNSISNKKKLRYVIPLMLLINNIISSKIFEISCVIDFLGTYNILIEKEEIFYLMNEICCMLNWNLDPLLSYSFINDISQDKKNLFKLIIFVLCLFNEFDCFSEKYKICLTLVILDEHKNNNHLKSFIEKTNLDKIIFDKLSCEFKNILISIKKKKKKGLRKVVERFCCLISDNSKSNLLPKFFKIMGKNLLFENNFEI